jgi:hypothetical protein
MYHAFINPKADGGDTTIARPSDWNALHKIPILNADPTPNAATPQIYEYQSGNYRAIRIMSSEGHVTTIEEWNV